MALTFGQMTTQILTETYRDSSFATAVENAIVSAIKELEIEKLYLNQKFVQLNVAANAQSVNLPSDFIAALMVVLLLNNGATAVTEANGFKEITFYELQTNTYNNNYNNTGVASGWALFGDQIWLNTVNTSACTLDLYYYYRDANYPTNPNDTSIWLGDHTQDVTRYTARGIFYRDVLQSPELASSDFAKAADALNTLKLRSTKRETINTLSF